MKKKYRLELSAYTTILGDNKINIVVCSDSKFLSYQYDHYDVIFQGDSVQNQYGEYEIRYNTNIDIYNKTLRLLMMKGCVARSEHDDSILILTEKAILNAL